MNSVVGHVEETMTKGDSWRALWCAWVWCFDAQHGGRVIRRVERYLYWRWAS